PVVSSIQGFNHMAIYSHEYGSQDLDLVYEGIANDSNRFTIRCVLELAKLFGNGTPAILRLDNLVTGATVMVDSTEAPVLDGCILTTAGEHTISVVAQGYTGRVFTTTLEGGEVSALNAAMVQMHFQALSIDSSPSAQVIVDGSVVGQTPMVLDLYTVPLNLRLTADGYSDTNMSILSRTGGIDVELKPEWMSVKGLLKERKDGFYGAFARSLLIFGAKIALRSINDGSNAVLSGLDIATDAALTVSIADLVGCLIDYYRQTEYIAR
ncbi:MAG: PEGA domain-containing protein, partial [Spirochaetales bacterium]|nr:PEGA domain-containing protein [Spirochaetales bacterium]